MNQNFKSDISKFIDSLFFNIYSFSPDSLILNFIKKYTSLLPQEIKTEPGGWTIYPEGHDLDKYNITRHSIEFKNHKAIPLPFIIGRLEVENEEHLEEIHTHEEKIILKFDSEESALEIYKFLCQKLESISETKRSQKIGNTIMNEFQSEVEDYINGISFMLEQDKHEYLPYTISIFPRANRFHFLPK